MREHAKETERSFESAFAELEEVVRQLEDGNLSLEEAISLYERGQALSRFCQARLDQAELRVTQLAADPDGSDRAAGAPDDVAC